MKYKSLKLFIIIGGLTLSVFFAFSFTPLSNQGDGPAYINYAMKLAGEDVAQSYVHRSPLYPFLLAGIIKISGVESLPRIVIVMQYLLIFASSVILFRFANYFLTETQSLVTVFCFFCSFSTIFYGYMILTEILAVFLFLLSIFQLLKWIRLGSDKNLILAGILTSLLILARFNTLPLITAFLFMIVYSLKFKNKAVTIFSISGKAFLYLLPLIVVLNIYAFYNLRTNDFYGLFPTGGSPLISRNAILATIDGSETVSEENRTVYNIFLEAATGQKMKATSEKSASLLQVWNPLFIKKLYSGFKIYGSAIPSLCHYYGIDPNVPEPQLSEKLKPFYKEIISLNRSRIIMMRAYSLLNSFRSSTGITMTGMVNVNLGRLPGWSIIAYKTAIILISVLTFSTTVVFVGYRIIKLKLIEPVLLTVIIFYLSFYIINFFFAIAGDSNRYKFPSEPLMFGLFVYFTKGFTRRILKRKFSPQNRRIIKRMVYGEANGSKTD